jgi:flagellar protein FlaG
MSIQSLSSGTNFAFANGNNDNQEVSQKTDANVEVINDNSSASGETNAVDVNKEQRAKVSDDLADNKVGQEFEVALAEVTEFIQTKNQDLTFSYDNESNRSIIKVTDANSGDVIRQIPTEEVIKLSERIKELQSDVGSSGGIGVLLNNEV